MCARPRKSPDAISAGMFLFVTFSLRQRESFFKKIKNFFIKKAAQIFLRRRF